MNVVSTRNVTSPFFVGRFCYFVLLFVIEDLYILCFKEEVLFCCFFCGTCVLVFGDSFIKRVCKRLILGDGTPLKLRRYQFGFCFRSESKEYLNY